jgi:predicted AlkP superfamily pyrophosphatase or phosphodiesterase
MLRAARALAAALALACLGGCATVPREAAPAAAPATARGAARVDHLILVTLDAVGEADREALASIPAFSRLMEEGSYSLSVLGTWPSLTYVAHAAIQTGRSPGANGIGNNRPFQPGVPDDRQAWYWYRDSIKVPTIFDLAGEAGLRTATVLFPLTGRARIDFNFPEVQARPGESQALKLAAAGDLGYMSDLELRFGRMHRGTREPQLDDFLAACAAYVIEEKKPGLLATHLVEVDIAKHETGTRSPEVAVALARQGERISRILAAIEEAGIADSTALVVIGDHGQFDIDRQVRLNILLQDEGLIRDGPKGLEWEAYLEVAGGCAILRAKDEASRQRALAVLRRAIAERPELGIERVVGREELDAYGVDPEVLWAVEGAPGTEFLDGIDGGLLREIDPAIERRGAHGYRPDIPGYRTVFFAIGPGVPAGREIADMSLLDAAPTIGALLGFEVPGAEGRDVLAGMREDR